MRERKKTSNNSRSKEKYSWIRERKRERERFLLYDAHHARIAVQSLSIYQLPAVTVVLLLPPPLTIAFISSDHLKLQSRRTKRDIFFLYSYYAAQEAVLFSFFSFFIFSFLICRRDDRVIAAAELKQSYQLPVEGWIRRVIEGGDTPPDWGRTETCALAATGVTQRKVPSTLFSRCLDPLFFFKLYHLEDGNTPGRRARFIYSI